MKIYTRTGDAGETGILGGSRVSKAAPRVQALGSLDELNAALGLVLTEEGLAPTLRAGLLDIQNLLFEAGAAVATPKPPSLEEPFHSATSRLEQWIDRAETEVEPLTQFILPGGALAGARLHWCRSVARRAERDLVLAVGAEPVFAPVLAWLNRVSDTLFVLARWANARAGVPETPWTRA